MDRLSDSDVVPRAVGALNHDHAFGDPVHHHSKLASLPSDQLRTRYVGLRSAYDALHCAVKTHNSDIRALGAHTRAEIRLDAFLGLVDTKTSEALHLEAAQLCVALQASEEQLIEERPTPQKYVVAILNLERWVSALVRAVDKHRESIGDVQLEDPAAREIDERLWKTSDLFAQRFGFRVDRRREAAR